MIDVTYRDVIPVDKCARCGYSEFVGSLHVHHINRDRSDSEPSNLIVLCANCHSGLHHGVWELSEIGILEPNAASYRNPICYMSTSGFAKVTNANQERRILDNIGVRLR